MKLLIRKMRNLVIVGQKIYGQLKESIGCHLAFNYNGKKV